MSYIPDMQILTCVAAWRIYTTRIFYSYLPLSYISDKHIFFLFAIVVYIRQAYFLPICQCRIHTTCIFHSYLPMSYISDIIAAYPPFQIKFIWREIFIDSFVAQGQFVFFFNVGYIRHWQNKKTILLKADFSAIEFPFFLTPRQVE